VFLLLSRELKKSGRSLHICNLRPYIYQVFEKIGFHLVIPIHQDIPSALAAIEGRSS
jgi:anti-anti-sigma regulatory factor